MLGKVSLIWPWDLVHMLTGDCWLQLDAKWPFAKTSFPLPPTPLGDPRWPLDSPDKTIAFDADCLSCLSIGMPPLNPAYYNCLCALPSHAAFHLGLAVLQAVSFAGLHLVRELLCLT